MMRCLKGVFALFPDFKKVRSLTASAEMTRQVEISTLSAHQMAYGGVVADTSSWTPAAFELEESAPWNSDVGGLSELLDGRREQGIRPLASRWEPGRCRNTGNEDFLLLFSGSMHRGGFVGVLGLRIVVQDVAASLMSAVAAATISILLVLRC